MRATGNKHVYLSNSFAFLPTKANLHPEQSQTEPVDL